MTKQIKEGTDKVATLLDKDGVNLEEAKTRRVDRGCFGDKHGVSNDDWYVPFGSDKTEDTRCEFCYKMGIVEMCEGPIKCDEVVYNPITESEIKCTVNCDSVGYPELWETQFQGGSLGIVYDGSPCYLLPEHREDANVGIGHYMVPADCMLRIRIVANAQIDNFKIDGEEMYQGVIHKTEKSQSTSSTSNLALMGNTTSFYFHYIAYPKSDNTSIITFNSTIDNEEEQEVKIYFHCFQTDDEIMRDNLAINLAELIDEKQKVHEDLQEICKKTTEIETKLDNIETLRQKHASTINKWLDYKQIQKEQNETDSEGLEISIVI